MVSGFFASLRQVVDSLLSLRKASEQVSELVAKVSEIEKDLSRLDAAIEELSAVVCHAVEGMAASGGAASFRTEYRR